MNSIFKKLFLKNSSNWKFWLLLGFVAKLALFLFKTLPPHPIYIDGFWGSRGGDTGDYLTPIENFLKSGSYDPDFRMPGYGAAYLPFIIFFSKATACNLLIIFQLLLSCISVYALALTAMQLFKSDILFYSTFYLYAISSFASLYDSFLLTESLTASLLIFSVYFLVKYFDTYKKTTLLMSGLLLTWVIFIRPVFIVALAFFYLIVIINSVKNKMKFTGTLFFLIPFMVIDGLWIIRNYIRYKEIVPLTQTIMVPGYANSYLMPAFNFVASWGGSFTWWDKKAEIRWFGIYWGTPKLISHLENEPSLPGYIYTSKFNKDSLESLKKMIIRLKTDTTMPFAMQINYNRFLSEKFNLYTESVKKEKPMLYYVKAPLKILKTFLIHSGTNNFFNKPSNELNRIEYLWKLFYSVFYILTIALGSIGIIILIKDIFRFSVIAVIPLIPLYVIIIHPLILRFSEPRYFIPAFPFMLVCAIYAVYWIMRKINKRKSDFKSKSL